MNFSRRCVIVAGACGLIGKQLTNTLLDEGRVFVMGIDVENSALKHSNYKHFQGSVLDLEFLEFVSAWIAESDMELVGIVCALAIAEQNNENSDFAQSLKHEFPEIESRIVDILAAWASYPDNLQLRAFEVHCLGSNNVVRSQLRNLLRSRRASVVHIASQYGVRVPRQSLFESSLKFRYKPSAYSLSKASLVLLTRYQASIFAGTEVRVNALSPGNVENLHETAFIEKYVGSTWTKRMMKVDEVVGPIQFLLSESSSYMNGANLIVDGGWTQF